jgi:hypothetical protein
MMPHAESTEGTEGVSRKSGKSFLNTKQSSPRITSISCIRGLIKYSIDSLDLREKSPCNPCNLRETYK